MDTKLLRTQLINDLMAKGCADSVVLADCISQTISASDILVTYKECFSFALSLYNAQMWGRRKSNDAAHLRRQDYERKFSQPTSTLATPKKQVSDDEIRIGGLILRRRS